MATITISGNDYFSYATVAEADEYLLPTSYNTVWTALTTDQKGGFLVQATRFLDTLSWSTTCEPLVDQESIKNATIEIAALLASGDTTILGQTPTADAVKRYKAGSVELEYQARPWFVQLNPWTNIPPFILNMIKPCLSGGQSATGYAYVSGTDGAAGDSIWNGDYQLARR